MVMDTFVLWRRGGHRGDCQQLQVCEAQNICCRFHQGLGSESLR